MQLSHTRPVASALFDDPNLVSCAGLVPIAALAQKCGLKSLTDEHLTVPTDKGSNAGAKVNALVAGMVAGADSIDDMRLLRHGAMDTLFDRPYAPSTLGSFLREFTFGHVRQLDAVACRSNTTCYVLFLVQSRAADATRPETGTMTSAATVTRLGAAPLAPARIVSTTATPKARSSGSRHRPARGHCPPHRCGRGWQRSPVAGPTAGE